MTRVALAASLLALALFAWAQARGVDPLALLDGSSHTSSPSSGSRSVYHK